VVEIAELGGRRTQDDVSRLVGIEGLVVTGVDDAGACLLLSVELVGSEQLANRVAVLCSDDGVAVQASRRARGRRVGADDEAGGHRRASVDELVAEALKPLWPTFVGGLRRGRRPVVGSMMLVIVRVSFLDRDRPRDERQGAESTPPSLTRDDLRYAAISA
jgi:hypothetical protein